MMSFRLMGGALGTAGLVAVLADQKGGRLALLTPAMRVATPAPELRAWAACSPLASRVSAGITAMALVAACAIRDVPLRSK